MKERPRVICGMFALLAVLATASTFAASAKAPSVRRVGDAPIVVPEMLPGDDGDSINGPSLIRVPDWVPDPLGRYYLYFAHHDGKYIRLAYADRIEGPWRVHPGGVLRLDDQKALRGHIASPEAVIDVENRRIHLFFHGNNATGEGPQVTSSATSTDGLRFTDIGKIVGPAYLRVFRYDGQWFGLTHEGTLRRAARLGEPFEPVGRVIAKDIAEAVDPALRGEPGAPPIATRPTKGEDRYGIRHIGLDHHGDRLDVYFSCVGHRPERILRTTIKLEGPIENWRAHGVEEVLEPERPWEGADLPLAYSRGGSTIKYGYKRVRELRDPTAFREAGRAWLIYSTAGEYGLGLAELLEDGR